MNPRVGWVAVVLAAMVMGAAGAYAQDTALETSSWSLELGSNLGFDDDFTTTIAIRRHLSPSSALRIGLGGTFSRSEGDGTQTATPSPTSDTDRLQEFYFYQASLQWIHYATVSDGVAAQFGLGPVMEVTKSYSRSSQQIGLPGFSESEFRSSSTLYGLAFSLGVEWFFTRRLSLGARASLQAMTGTRDEVNNYRTAASRTESEIEMDATSVRTQASHIFLTGYF
jgi:hypothetical protein